MAKSTKGAADFLRSNSTMAALLPALARMGTLQQSVAASLPAMFAACQILQFEAGVLVMSAPNAALAARLKQQTPRLQDRLLKDGWQVNSIRIKVQVGKTAPAAAQTGAGVDRRRPLFLRRAQQYAGQRPAQPGPEGCDRCHDTASRRAQIVQAGGESSPFPEGK
jgi:hypothetical protein